MRNHTINEPKTVSFANRDVINLDRSVKRSLEMPKGKKTQKLEINIFDNMNTEVRL